MKTKGGFPFALLFIITLLLATAFPIEAPAAGEHPWLNGARPAQVPVSPWERHYIEGFAWPPSIRQGESIKIYVSVKDTVGNKTFTLSIFRLPNETTPVTDPQQVTTGQYFPLHDVNGNAIPWGSTSFYPLDYQRGCLSAWQAGARTFDGTMTAGWQSGLYYAKLEHNGLSITNGDKVFI